MWWQVLVSLHFSYPFCVLYFIRTICAKGKESLAVYGCVGLTIHSAIGCKNKNGGGNQWMPIGSLANYYRYYLIGFLCRKYVRLYNLFFYHPVSYAIGFIFLALQFVYADKCNYVLAFLGALGGVILLQGVFASISDVENNKSRLLKALAFIGTKTLPIYLIHYFFIPDMKRYGELLIGIGNPFIIHLAVCLLLALAIIIVLLLVEHIIDKNKYLAWLLLGKAFK